MTERKIVTEPARASMGVMFSDDPGDWPPEPDDWEPEAVWADVQSGRDGDLWVMGAPVDRWPIDRWPGEAAADAGGEWDSSEVALWRERLSSGMLPGQQGALIDLLRGLEDFKSAAAAVQARAAVAFEAARRQAEADAGLSPSRRGVGVAAEVALARRESPHKGGRLMGLARAMVHELPHTLMALGRGTLNEWRATLVVRETACLKVEDRMAADEWLGSQLAQHPAVGDKRLVAEVRRKVIELDQQAVVRRRRRRPSSAV